MNMFTQTIPRLRNGDNLTLDEFLQRWEESPEIKRAELIGGTVYMPSPVGSDHGDMEFQVTTWLGLYVNSTPGLSGSNNISLVMDQDCLQPDIHLRLAPELGGKTRLEGKIRHGVPELVVEICISSKAYDLKQKYDIYQEQGVPEYLAILVEEEEIRWHILTGGQYQLMPPGDDEVWRSQILPGLWLAGKALLSQDMAAVTAAQLKGLQAEEYLRFRKALQERAEKNDTSPKP